MKGGDKVGYKVKRGARPTDSSIKEIVRKGIQRLAFFLIMVAVSGVFLYFAYQYAYHHLDPFREAADDVWTWIHVFYAKHGVWATVGLVVAILMAIWALGEEGRRRDRRKEAMKEMMK